MMLKKKKIKMLAEKMSNNKPTQKNGRKDKRQMGHFRKAT